MQIELSSEEVSQLLALVDLAVKAGGLQAATVALPLAQKIQQSASQSQESTE